MTWRAVLPVIAVAVAVGTTRVEAKLWGHDVVVQGAGRDGFGLVGKGYHVTRTRAEGSHRYGYAMWGSAGTVGADGSSVVALGSGMTGFNLMGMGHTLIGCVATGGLKDGVT